ncbi:hypothetical protein RHM65_01460 [Pseudomonas sp. CCI4.2]|uniref:hypothetical protein n=1 Tax=Pseudomonas sp. CCI4.2 TaxID=3048620 RepID=UPI002AC96664|nr:hypothetical protein [Pseudomonas sp. CCI4.2]MEB0092241.1 hypothetical protein [Pseudomonas sp. CCI4.2]WPX54288.1 hypothetical protein RHM65_01460 [Pseudomonas sp. CCI4.2]
MSNVKLLTGLICAIVLTGCASEPPKVRETVSGKPEGVFRNTSVEDARYAIINQCANKGLSVEESTGNQVVCSKEMEGSQAIATQVVLGNSYSTTPQVKARFVFAKKGTDTRVICYAWYETVMALGQVKTMEASSNTDFNGLMSFLSNAGAE